MFVYRGLCGVLTQASDGSYRHFANGEALPSEVTGSDAAIEGEGAIALREFYNVRLWRLVGDHWFYIGQQAIVSSLHKWDVPEEAAWFPVDFNPNCWGAPATTPLPVQAPPVAQAKPKPRAIAVEMISPTQQETETPRVVQTTLF